MNNNRLNLFKILRASFWLYISNIINNLCGFLYWMVISYITSASTVGIISAIVGFASLISGILKFGTDASSLRFYGKAIGENNKFKLSKYFWSIFLYFLTIYGSVFVCVFFLAVTGLEIGGLKTHMLMFSSIFILLSITICTNALVISLLRTDVHLLATVIGNALKFSVGITLVLSGYGWIGALIGYMCPNIVRLIVTLTFSLRIVIRKLVFSLNALRDVLIAGFASWLPSIISLLGRWLGVLVVFGVAGAVQTGYYYIAFAIANVILMIARSMLNLLLPVLSGMVNGRKYATFRVLKISSAFMFPMAVFFMFYPFLPLSILGKEYVNASLYLSVFLLSSLPIVIGSSVNSLIYAYGYYKLVLILGLAANVPRIAFYYLLVPIYGGLGAAISFTLGSFSEFITALIISRKVNFYINFKDLIVIAGAPLIPATLSYLLNLPWLVSGILILGSCLICYPSLKVISRSDLKEVSKAFLDEEKVNRLYYRFKALIDFLFKE